LVASLRDWNLEGMLKPWLLICVYPHKLQWMSEVLSRFLELLVTGGEHG